MGFSGRFKPADRLNQKATELGQASFDMDNTGLVMQALRRGKNSLVGYFPRGFFPPTVRDSITAFESVRRQLGDFAQRVRQDLKAHQLEAGGFARFSPAGMARAKAALPQETSLTIAGKPVGALQGPLGMGMEGVVYTLTLNNRAYAMKIFNAVNPRQFDSGNTAVADEITKGLFLSGRLDRVVDLYWADVANGYGIYELAMPDVDPLQARRPKPRHLQGQARQSLADLGIGQEQSTPSQDAQNRVGGWIVDHGSLNWPQ